jgi:ribonucleoside-diphosphate reductase beta chain
MWDAKKDDKTTIVANPLFNPAGDDTPAERTIIKGNTTGLFNLNATKYMWAKSMYQVMVGNFWLPEKVKWLGDDAVQFTKLSADEQRAYKGILSFLIFLDSIQTANLPNFSEYITAPEVQLLLSIQAFQEAIHSQSYATILETVVDSKDREDIYYFWRTDKHLLERNTFIGGIYQDFIDNPSDKNLFRGFVANFLLESICLFWYACQSIKNGRYWPYDQLYSSWWIDSRNHICQYYQRSETWISRGIWWSDDLWYDDDCGGTRSDVESAYSLK